MLTLLIVVRAIQGVHWLFFLSSLALLRHGFPPTGVLQQSAVNFVWRQVYVSDDRAANENVLDGTEVGIFQFV